MWTVGLTQLLVKVVRINPPSHHPRPLEALGYAQWEEETWSSDVWTYFTVAAHPEVPSVCSQGGDVLRLTRRPLPQKWGGLNAQPASF